MLSLVKVHLINVVAGNSPLLSFTRGRAANAAGGRIPASHVLLFLRRREFSRGTVLLSLWRSPQPRRGSHYSRQRSRCGRRDARAHHAEDISLPKDARGTNASASRHASRPVRLRWIFVEFGPYRRRKIRPWPKSSLSATASSRWRGAAEWARSIAPKISSSARS